MSAELQKYEDDIFPVSVTFEKKIVSPEILVLDDSTVTVKNSSGEDITSSIIVTGSKANIDARLFATFTGGIIGEIYIVKFTGVSDLGNKYNFYIRLKIIDFITCP